MSGPAVCICGREFAKAFGLRVHQRACPLERVRSDAWIRAIETGRDARAAAAQAVREFTEGAAGVQL